MQQNLQFELPLFNGKEQAEFLANFLLQVFLQKITFSKADNLLHYSDILLDVFQIFTVLLEFLVELG